MCVAVMASPRWSASMLLASLILLYWWPTSSARSHYSTNPSALYRVNRDLPYGSKDQIERTLNTVQNALSVIKDAVEVNKNTLPTILKSLSSFVTLAPGVGTFAFSVINMVLAFIPQDDPVLNEVKKGFAEVNRKLDSLSIQMSNLAADVEWFNYASVYSQDELRILNAWRKFHDFFKIHEHNDLNHLAEIFINYYEYTQAEASVLNLYHYLTVSSTTLSGNLNHLLKRKFKCDIGEISKYNLYFSSLLWKGMVLNEFYWKLMGFDSSGKEAEHTQMFKNVYKAQRAVVDDCLKNYKQYVMNDVEEIGKALSPDNKKNIADQVKKALDKKYSWYSWVVLVYNTDQEKNHKLYNMIKIPMGTVTVAVDYTLKAELTAQGDAKQLAKECYGGKKPCKPVQDCSYFPWETFGGASDTLYLRDYAKVTHVAYEKEFVEVPEPLERVDCLWDGYASEISVYYSWKVSVCSKYKCKNNGQCNVLLESNEWLCECQDGYYGDTCEKKINTQPIQEIKTTFPLPTINTTNSRLKIIQSKLDSIINRCQG